MKPLGEIRILVVEDDVLVNESIRGLLEDSGFAIAGFAFDGQEAVQMAQLLQPTLILMDIDMPEMDGLKAAELIFQFRPVPVVALTAYEKIEFIKEATRIGILAYIIKPPNAAELEQAISIALARFDDAMELRRLKAQGEADHQLLIQTLAKIEALEKIIKNEPGRCDGAPSSLPPQ